MKLLNQTLALILFAGSLFFSGCAEPEAPNNGEPPPEPPPSEQTLPVYGTWAYAPYTDPFSGVRYTIKLKIEPGKLSAIVLCESGERALTATVTTPVQITTERITANQDAQHTEREEGLSCPAFIPKGNYDYRVEENKLHTRLFGQDVILDREQ